MYFLHNSSQCKLDRFLLTSSQLVSSDVAFQAEQLGQLSRQYVTCEGVDTGWSRREYLRSFLRRDVQTSTHWDAFQRGEDEHSCQSQVRKSSLG